MSWLGTYLNIKKSGLKQKKVNIIEIQINGGSISDKIAFCMKILSKEIPIDDIFKKNENIDNMIYFSIYVM